MTALRKTLRSVTERAPLWNGKDTIGSPAKYVDVSAVSRDDLAIQSVATLPVNHLPSRARKFVRAGDTLFATVRPGLRRVAMVPAELDGALASTAFCVLRPDPDQVDPTYLYFAAASDSFVQRVADLQTGASYPAVRDRDILDQEIDLPDPAEQRTIGSVLSFVWNSVQREGRLIVDAEALKRAAMRQLFTRGLRGQPQRETEIGLMAGSWTPAPLPAVCSMRTGGTPPKSDSSLWTGEVPWVSGKDLKSVRLSSVRDCISSDAARKYSEVAPAGSVLVLVRGMGLANGLALSLLEKPMAFNQDLRALIPNGVTPGAYLMHALTFAGPRLLRDVTRAAHGTMRLGQKDLASFRIPLSPDVDEQREIVQILDAIDQKIDLHKRKKAVLEELFKALLHKLMTGEIRVSDLDLSALESKDK